MGRYAGPGILCHRSSSSSLSSSYVTGSPAGIPGQKENEENQKMTEYLPTTYWAGEVHGLVRTPRSHMHSPGFKDSFDCELRRAEETRDATLIRQEGGRTKASFMFTLIKKYSCGSALSFFGSTSWRRSTGDYDCDGQEPRYGGLNVRNLALESQQFANCHQQQIACEKG